MKSKRQEQKQERKLFDNGFHFLLYNIFIMTNLQKRKFLLLMNQESLIHYQKMLESLAFLLAVKKVFQGKDSQNEEVRFSDKNVEKVYDNKEVILEMIRSAKSDDKKLNQMMEKSKVIPFNLQEDIHTILDMKEDQNNILETIFTPRNETDEEFNEAYADFLMRIAMVLRVTNWIMDIADGIQEYGVEPYVIPEEDNKNGLDALNDVYDMKEEELEEELGRYLILKYLDDDDTIQNKVALKELLKSIKKERR